MLSESIVFLVRADLFEDKADFNRLFSKNKKFQYIFYLNVV